ncbi:F-box/kelch-repeat protein At3g06240-like [Andrographis paniculata]|uniref:F-box/kelch-repeat protein At3g06240-like n=1 Tax=Andrographis paniculata TaxID=175694 RepID=UPI0021E8543F|nr:F-box/kelch-repeat protein At3g06240-like [Andrographis paniculata]
MKLPEDLVLEILSRLPVKSLVRFRSVCTSWNHSIVKDFMFVSRHYKNVLLKQRDLETLLISRRDDGTNRRVISLLENDDGNGDNTTTLVNQEPPTSFLNDIFGHVRLIGPCNGIICLYGYTDHIALWNPSIHDFKILPRSHVLRPLHARIRGGDLGIGFDPTTCDLKVMQILFCITSDNHLTYHVEIYSSRTNTWKIYQHNIPGNIMYYNIWSMVYKDETFCWWAQDDDNNNNNNSEIILSFNMRNEVFRKTPLPLNIQDLGGQDRTTRAILPLKESIALLVYNLKDSDKVFDIWVANQVGIGRDDWTRLPSVGPISNVERPLGFWKNNEELVLESSKGELVVFKIRDQEISNFGIYGKRNRLEMVAYKESLFRVNM